MNNLNYFNNSEICSHSEFFINHENTLECLQINWSQITLNSLDAFVEDCVLEEFANTGISGFFAGEEIQFYVTTKEECLAYCLNKVLADEV